jgi:hypothetical protein
LTAIQWGNSSEAYNGSPLRSITSCSWTCIAEGARVMVATRRKATWI